MLKLGECASPSNFHRPHGRGWRGGSPHPPGVGPACGVGPSDPRSDDRGHSSWPSPAG